MTENRITIKGLYGAGGAIRVGHPVDLFRPGSAVPYASAIVESIEYASDPPAPPLALTGTDQ